MKKENFVSLLLGTIGGILFSLGMCMCLIAEWNTMKEGVVIGAVGVIALLAMIIVRRVMQGKPAIVLNGKAIFTVLWSVFGALVLGLGMCMTMVWEGLLVQGIVVGIVGIGLLLALIPLCMGLK